MKRIVIILFSVVFIIGMAGLMIYFIIKHDSLRWVIALGGIALSALPLGLLFLKNNRINTPTVIGWYIFVFCSIGLGSIGGFYDRFKWWDTSVHFYKGVFVACVGITLYKMFIPETARRNVSRWIPVLFVLSLAVIASVLWEVYEFLGDVIASHTMQRGGNTDTMYDLLAGLFGGIAIAVYTGIRKQNV
ncbi:hypothetical protein BpJC7_14190 [Weizmannia acidilactici]|uniref:Membrane-spanning protein n=1 Tax=Weizmannia acidilactici TaxID=2607726 RepID=A0A5J4J5A9_9BACI|nr:membrane-spanning protein [Weizmannia acidilactici]GER66863.1 hypothetical protein BpJC4_13340 [Weizmannia acidilactici]GER70116.1 hypothetical protein BpJC7_14190 [Weizmannia acidilactici]